MKKMRDLLDAETPKIYGRAWEMRETATATGNPLIKEAENILGKYAIYEAENEWLQPWLACNKENFLRFCALGALALDEEAACISLSKVFLKAVSAKAAIKAAISTKFEPKPTLCHV